jgi:peroxiredoxin
MWITILLVVALLIGILRHIGILYEQSGRHRASTDLRAGQVLPDLTLSTFDGSRLRISHFAGHATHFVVVAPNCSACGELLSRLQKAASDDSGAMERHVIVSMGNRAATAELLQVAGMVPNSSVLIDEDEKIKGAWGVRATPVTLEVDEQLKVLRQIIGAADLRQLPPLVQLSGAPQAN